MIGSVAGLIVFLAFFLDIRALALAEAQIQDWGVVVAAFALVMAAVNLIYVNLKTAARGPRLDKICAYVLIGALVIMAFIGIVRGPTDKAYTLLFDGIMAPGDSTVWAIGVFYIASAAYRAFRIKNADAVFLLFSCAFVMLGAVPLGEAIWPKIPVIGDWIFDVPNMAAMRGMLIGTGVGAFSGGLRILLGVERTHSG